MTTDTTDRRLIASTWAGTDMADREHADTLRTLIDAIPRTAYVRRSETYPKDNWCTPSASSPRVHRPGHRRRPLGRVLLRRHRRRVRRPRHP